MGTGERVLVVYFSRTGNTRRLGEAIANVHGWDVEELFDTRDRTGLLGYLRCALDGTLARLTRVGALRKDPAAYDLVVVGTPVWNAAISAAARTFLVENRARLRDVALFVTHAGRGNRRALRQMEELVGRTPVGTLAVKEREVARGGHLARAARFADALRETLSLRRAGAPAPPPPAPPPRPEAEPGPEPELR